MNAPGLSVDRRPAWAMLHVNHDAEGDGGSLLCVKKQRAAAPFGVMAVPHGLQGLVSASSERVSAVWIARLAHDLQRPCCAWCLPSQQTHSHHLALRRPATAQYLADYRPLGQRQRLQPEALSSGVFVTASQLHSDFFKRTANMPRTRSLVDTDLAVIARLHGAQMCPDAHLIPHLRARAAKLFPGSPGICPLHASQSTSINDPRGRQSLARSPHTLPYSRRLSQRYMARFPLPRTQRHHTMAAPPRCLCG